MNRRLLSWFSVFSIVIILSVVFLLIGCGGGKKEEPAASITPVPAAASEQPPRPLPAAESSAESTFESDELDYKEETINGVLNWSKGFIRAKGYGVPPENAISIEQGKLMAFRAAYAGALANLLEITNGVQVTATTTVKDYVVKDHTIELKVGGIIKGSKEVRRIFNEEKNIAIIEVGITMEEVAMGIPNEGVAFDDSLSLEIWETKEDATLLEIAGGNAELAAALKSSKNMEEIEQKLNKMSKDNQALASTNEQLAASIQLLIAEMGRLRPAAAPANYTGVVVNAAGSGIKPVMAPNIYYKSGDTYKLLYGLNDGRARDNSMHALVVWERTLDGASDNTRVTKTPLVINATHLSKEQAALAISEKDAKMIEEANKTNKFLENGKVVIVR